MEENLVRVVAKISVYILILPLILAFRRIVNGDREQKVLSLLIFTIVFFELAVLVVGSFFLQQNNRFLLHIFTVIEFGFLVYIFKDAIKDLISERNSIFLIGAFSVFAILNSIFIESITKTNAFAKAIESILVFFLILAYFYSVLKNLSVRSLEKSPLFWVAVGSLLYFSGSLFIFIFSNYIMPSSEVDITIWGIHAFLNITLNLFYTLALWVNPKP